MLDRNKPSQFHYYQPGIGTYTTSIWQSYEAHKNRLKRWFLNTKDAAMGTTFDEHVMDGYRYLMRFYCPGDCIYIFGFSRGAYVARMVAEMLDHIGLLEAGNEGKVRYVWNIFSQWAKQSNSIDAEQAEKDRLYEYMKALRETFCRPVSQVRFLGLFDTVNSIPRFEVNRNKFLFPYTARTSARVIRHAVAIDEHRAKFREDLLSDSNPNISAKGRKRRARMQGDGQLQQGHYSGEAFYRPSRRQTVDSGDRTLTGSPRASYDAGGCSEDTSYDQDIEEVWFAGCHADIGGGVKLDDDDECFGLSHVPLVWMVNEAQRAGLKFDPEKRKLFHCFDDSEDTYLPGAEKATGDQQETTERSQFRSALWRAATTSRIHDFLRYGQGVAWSTVLTWKIVEYLPLRRMGLQEDGSWRPVRWPVPLGERRDVPKDARVHASAIRRMQANSNYRPDNLIRGKRWKKKCPQEYGIGTWEVYAHHGCPIRETYKKMPDTTVCSGSV